MILLNGFYHRVWSGCWCRLEGGMEVTGSNRPGLADCPLPPERNRHPVPGCIARMFACVPMASRVTMQPSKASVKRFRNRGLLVRLPGRRPLPQYQSHAGSKALTRCKGEQIFPERRLVLPSRAITVSGPITGRMLLTQRRNADSNSPGSINPNRRPNVSWDGMPCFSQKITTQPVQALSGPKLRSRRMCLRPPARH